MRTAPMNMGNERPPGIDPGLLRLLNRPYQRGILFQSSNSTIAAVSRFEDDMAELRGWSKCVQFMLS